MEREEFAKRVHLLTDRMYRIAYGQLREVEDRRDAVQNALAKAWANREKLNNEAYFETWLIRILLNECHNIQRGRKRFAPEKELPEIPQEETTGNAEVRDAVLRLSEKLRIVVILYYMDGYRTEEIAHILRVPTDTVRTRLKRARKALREMLKEEE